MDLNEPEGWRWIWAMACVAFLGAELVTPAAFFVLPFALGCALAALSAFAGASLPVEIGVFLASSAAAFGLLWPLGRRLDRTGNQGQVGATRWVGREAVVLQEIPSEVNGTGLVRLDREQWRAESGSRTKILVGSTVLVTRVDGTRLVVLPLEDPPRSLEEGNP
jgi:membrane protein implicated in regulation of membrane protease activity